MITETGVIGLSKPIIAINIKKQRQHSRLALLPHFGVFAVGLSKKDMKDNKDIRLHQAKVFDLKHQDSAIGHSA